MRHVVGVLAVAACLAGLVSQAGAAELTASATMSPSTVVFPGTKEIVWRVEIRSGDQDETFAIEMDPPLFETEPGFAEGSPVGTPRYVVEGAIEPLIERRYYAYVACSPVDLRTHGYEPAGLQLEVRMPANSAGAVTVRRPFGEAPWPAPWPGTELRTRFELTNDVRGSLLLPNHGTLEREQVVSPPAPKRSGATGVQIRLATVPHTGRSSGTKTKVQAGIPIAVTGSVDPPLPGARLELRYFSPDNARGELRTLGHVGVDDAGRFELAGWRPRRSGYHEVWAFYKADRAGVVDDFSCPRTFDLEGEYRPPDEPGKLVVRSSSARLVRFGAVPLRITCKGGRDCDSKVALATVAGRRISGRRVVLGAGLSQRVFFPLNAAWRRALAKRGRIDAVAGADGARRPVVLRPPRR